jgi:hypothetical protein
MACTLTGEHVCCWAVPRSACDAWGAGGGCLPVLLEGLGAVFLQGLCHQRMHCSRLPLVCFMTSRALYAGVQ